jgi:putative lipoprotein
MPFFCRAATRLITILAFAVLSGCAWLPLSGTPEPSRLQGLMQLTAEGARLETCAGPIYEVRADAALRTLFSQVAPPGQTTVFVDLHATLLADDSIQPETIIRMGSTGRGCSDLYRQSSQWLALGEQPAWQVLIEPLGMQVQMGADTGTQSAFIAEQLPDSVRSFRTQEGEPVELWIYPQPCIAPRSGDYHEGTARLLYADKSLSGCAYRGMLGDDQPPR